MDRNADRPDNEKDALDQWAAQADKSGGQEGESDDEGDKGQDKDRDGKKKSPFANIWVKIAIVVVLLLLIVGGIIWWLIARQYESTDDAFVDTHIVHVSPQIAGQILSIHVNDNQMVRAGQPLVDIDARPQMAQLEQALAQRLQATTQIEQARANTRGADAQVTNTSRDLARYRLLQA